MCDLDVVSRDALAELCRLLYIDYGSPESTLEGGGAILHYRGPPLHRGNT